MKIALIYSFRESDWFSVTKILKNLISAYEKAYGKDNLVHINVPWDYKSDELEQSVSKLMNSKCSKIVFLDHKPHPIFFLTELGLTNIKKFKEILVHVYGDFTLTFKEWGMFDKLLLGCNIKFICASEKQVKLVKSLTNQSDGFYQCPFPVQEKEFYFDQSNRKKIRNKYNLDESDVVYLYVGRISKQKRNLETIKAFLDLRKSGELDNTHVFLVAGSFDLLGQPFFDEGQLVGESFRRIMQVIESYSAEVQESVKFIGNIENSELINYYNAADFFISLSTYHDEDYGMAVAEALCSGLPAILTNWAGYSSFKVDEQKEATYLVDTKLAPKLAEIDIDTFKLYLKNTKKNKLVDKDRAEISNSYHKKFSVNGISQVLKDISNDESKAFQGFGELLHRLASASVFRKTPFMSEFDKCYNEFYFEVYAPYVE